MSKIYKKDPIYFLQLCRYNIPGDEDDNDEADQKKWKKISNLMGGQQIEEEK